LIIPVEIAIQAIREYNAGCYKGRRNIDLDHEGYELFQGGLSDDENEQVEQLRFVAEEYGAVQQRFLPHSIVDEARLVAKNLAPILDEWGAKVAQSRPLRYHSPDEGVLELLLRPFTATKRWPVWAAKVLHFLRPDVFPILDSRAECALGISPASNPVSRYARFCSTFREVLLANEHALACAREVDKGNSPSDLKLLDKILFEMGKGGNGGRCCGGGP